MESTGVVRVPAVPAIAEWVGDMCLRVFKAQGRELDKAESRKLRETVRIRLDEAFRASPRSKIAIHWEAPPGTPLGYRVEPEIRTLAIAYERWVGSSPEEPLFGSHADAKVLDWSARCSNPDEAPVLDVGAGTGRNAVALARRGHPVDALEITPSFAEELRARAEDEGLPLRVLLRDLFSQAADLRSDYQLMLLSEVVPDFRGGHQLRQAFEVAEGVLADGGTLLFNVHLVAAGYTPDRAAREFAQQCYSALFTWDELTQACQGRSLDLMESDVVLEFEREHLPAEAWPPTRWYTNWVQGLDVYDVDGDSSPAQMRWLVYRKRGRDQPAAADSSPSSKGCPAPLTYHPKVRVGPSVLREAMLRRLARRSLASGSLTVPAVPEGARFFVEQLLELFGGFSRKVTPDQAGELDRNLREVLVRAFDESPRSNVVVTYEIPMGMEVRYKITADPVPMAAVYEDWWSTLPEPLFGQNPDAKVMALFGRLKFTGSCRVLDLGAGLGRNALALAECGIKVDAVEMVGAFAEHLTQAAEERGLPIRVIADNLFGSEALLVRDYDGIIAVGLVGDFRGYSELKKLMELASSIIREDGQFLVGLHVAADGYRPESIDRQWAQQCCATFFGYPEIEAAIEGLGLRLVSDESVCDFERTHLPRGAWPPTAVFEEWCQARHMMALPRQSCPVEQRWLVFRRLASTS